jgi:hypothetical protein
VFTPYQKRALHSVIGDCPSGCELVTPGQASAANSSRANTVNTAVEWAENSKLADRYGRRIRDILFEGSGMGRLAASVNYANGDETADELYGDSGRVAKLRKLKTVYDPESHFRFFNPII